VSSPLSEMSDMIQCNTCGTQRAHVIKESRPILFRDTSLMISEHEVTKCDSCDERYYTREQARDLDRKVIRAYRERHNLLSSTQIKAIRAKLLLSQRQLEEALGVGEKTVVRWENNTSVQGKNTDNVLRMIDLDPDNLRLIVRLRNAALVPQVAKNLPEDMTTLAGMRAAIFSGLEQFQEVSSLINQITDSVCNELIKYRAQRIEHSVRESKVAL